MTRFARAKGSKASNERVPEDATPWSEMKTQLLKKNQEKGEHEQKQKANSQRAKNYQTFLNEIEEEKLKNVKWAEFSDGPPKRKDTKNPKETTEIVKQVAENDGPKKEKQKKNDDGAGDNHQPSEKKKRKRGNVPNASNKVENTDPKVEKTTEDKDSTTQGQQTKKGKKRKLVADANVTFQKNEQQPFKAPQQKKPKLARAVSGKTGKPTPKLPPTEEDAKRIEKKKQKRVRQLEKRKLHKPKKEGQKPERRTQLKNRMIINGKEVDIAYVDGFPIKKEDAERIHQLRKQMISKGLPRSEIKIALKLERRKAEKAFAREKKKVCFNCRKSGHNLSECPDLGGQVADAAGTGICFKCGSTEHTHFDCRVVKGQEFKFAQCFICREQGHIARQCPDNARGLYPKGGACKVCGDVTHLKKDCPKFQAQQQQLEQQVQLDTISGDLNPDVLDKDDVRTEKPKIRHNKVVKF